MTSCKKESLVFIIKDKSNEIKNLLSHIKDKRKDKVSKFKILVLGKQIQLYFIYQAHIQKQKQ